MAKGLVQLAKADIKGEVSKDESRKVMMLEAVENLKRAEGDFSAIGVPHRTKDCIYIKVRR